MLGRCNHKNLLQNAHKPPSNRPSEKCRRSGVQEGYKHFSTRQSINFITFRSQRNLSNENNLWNLLRSFVFILNLMFTRKRGKKNLAVVGTGFQNDVNAECIQLLVCGCTISWQFTVESTWLKHLLNTLMLISKVETNSLQSATWKVYKVNKIESKSHMSQRLPYRLIYSFCSLSLCASVPRIETKRGMRAHIHTNPRCTHCWGETNFRQI